MQRLFVVVAAIIVAGQTGCSSARYVQRSSDEGVVAIRDRSNTWPTYNHDKAVELIREHVGPEYVIVEEWADKSGDAGPKPQPRDVSTNNQLFFLPNDTPRNRAATDVADATEWRIRYRRRTPGGAGWLPQSGGATASNAMPASFATGQSSGVMQAGYQSSAIPPLVQQAGTPQPQQPGTPSGVVPAAFQTPATVSPLVLPPTTVGTQAGGNGVIPPPVLPAGWR